MSRVGTPPAVASAIVAGHVVAALAAHRRRGGRCLTVGLCGAQGSGKSTAAAAAAATLAARGLKVATLSLDDLYLDRAARERLAAEVHPLMRTRGPPGTHDVDLGIRTLDALAAGAAPPLPRFDKARDEPAPPSLRATSAPLSDVILFEGWCVGARAEPARSLDTAINDLERIEDADGRWRRHVNAMLAGPYQRLFRRIDTLVLLAAPDMATVIGWRQEQERRLRAGLAAAGEGLGATMDDAQVARFVGHYERLTRHIQAEMPARSQLCIRLDPDRRAVGIDRRGLLVHPAATGAGGS